MAEQPKAAPSPQPAAPAPDAGHIPITEEMDSARWTLPPMVPIVIGLVLVAVVVGIVAFSTRPTPAATGEILDIQAVEMTAGNSVLVAVNVRLKNATEKTVYLKTVYGELELPDKLEPLKDEAASFVDFERYYAGFPALRTNDTPPLKPETQLAPGQETSGRVMFSFTVPKAQFDARKSLSVKLDLYDQRPIVLTR